ncbi:hypothetical protein M0Q50_03635 [bacterium]|jgi:hypothetical protein|nr:hypothetical protein [bacterium]
MVEKEIKPFEIEIKPFEIEYEKNYAGFNRSIHTYYCLTDNYNEALISFEKNVKKYASWNNINIIIRKK